MFGSQFNPQWIPGMVATMLSLPYQACVRKIIVGEVMWCQSYFQLQAIHTMVVGGGLSNVRTHKQYYVP